MPLVDQPFGDTFTFVRDRAAECRDATGAVVEVAADAPRFDHTAEGQPRGLLVEGRPQFAAADRLEVIDGDWAVAGGTILHEFETPAAVIERRAWYAPDDPLGAVRACLNAKGHHRRIAYVAGYLPNRGGFVRWRDLFWNLGGVVLADAGVALAPITDTPLLEG